VSIILKTFCNISFTKLSADFTISFSVPHAGVKEIRGKAKVKRETVARGDCC